MSRAQRDKTVALAAIFQAATLADALAWHGHCDPVALADSLDSILVLDSDDTHVIYGRHNSGLRAGIQALEQALITPLRGRHPRQADIVRYVLGLIQIERQLAGSAELLNTLRRRLEQANIQRAHYDQLTDPRMLHNLGSIYLDTIGQLPLRLQIKGDKQHLARPGAAEQVRAALLSGIRAAWLWHRLGGRRWQLLLTRQSILREIREIIKENNKIK